MANDEDKILGLLAHILGIFTWFIGALVIFLVKKDKKGLAYENARNALNFQISLTIYYVAATILIFGLFGILYGVLWVFTLITSILGAVKAYNGEVYSYPLTIKFIKN